MWRAIRNNSKAYFDVKDFLVAPWMEWIGWLDCHFILEGKLLELFFVRTFLSAAKISKTNLVTLSPEFSFLVDGLPQPLLVVRLEVGDTVADQLVEVEVLPGEKIQAGGLAEKPEMRKLLYSAEHKHRGVVFNYNTEQVSNWHC